MTSEQTNDQADGARSELVARQLIAVANACVTRGIVLPTQGHDVAAAAYSWWRLIHRSAEAVLMLAEQGLSSEAAPIMRNIFNHTYALHWLIDNGEPALHALISYGRDENEKLVTAMEKAEWRIAATAREIVDDEAATDPEPVRNEADQKKHAALKGEIRTVSNLFVAYGSSDLYPVYSHLSALSHTSSTTANAYMKRGDDELEVRSAPVDFADAYRVHIAYCLVQASSVFGPLLGDDDPLRQGVEQAVRDLGIENLELLPGRKPKLTRAQKRQAKA